MAKYSCGELVAEYLIRMGVPYVTGGVGHGCLCLVEGLIDRQDKLKFIPAKHEQCGVHLADGYARATGKPLAVFTSVGPGAFNTVMGIATAFCDSVPMLVFTGEGQTYMFGKGALQTVDRKYSADFPSVTRPITKRTWQITNIKQLPEVLPTAYRLAISGRPGPVHIDLPMDVQADVIETNLFGPANYHISTRMRPESSAVERAAEMLISAKRPAILAGGGTIMSEATPEIVELAEYLGIPVLTSFAGKGAIPEDHPLCAFYTGFKGSNCGTEIAKKADVLLALGYRFTEWSTSSFTPGVSFNIPPSKVIQVDLDEHEIGRCYPIEMGIMADIKSFLQDILSAVKTISKKRNYQETAYYKELQSLKEEWEKTKADLVGDTVPMRTSRFLKELREFLPRDGIVAGAAGYSQMQIYHEFPIYQPRTYISSASFAPMGMCIASSIGAKLAFPERVVVGVMGDGDFLMNPQELATAVQYNIPVIYCVLNNFGWISIRDLLINFLDRHIATEFVDSKTGKPYNPDFVKLAEAFGAYAERVEDPDEIQPALRRAQNDGRPALLEIMTTREYGVSGGVTLGLADTPSPRRHNQ